MIELQDKYGNPLSEREIQRQVEEQRRERRTFIIRNWLNGIFIVLSLIAIVGVMVFKGGERGLYISYGIAVLAVVIKMVEAMFRMPGFRR